ncbi:zinc-binding alcohol dehydrogenase family protein [Sulfitobacter pontiacus]|uniref:zinc-binding alcohol dehydrogenase family protein n=1 Tax=Sulfitobacter pontiacus TaxID=60137 RepID=UPI00276DA2E4|nr:zinc-binding alcohol dehydrogenase family protein [Sulfitobacter pontiacus]GLO79884.1 hypothetical protein MACH23_33050 [Sulfitobacter pontiacus]
MPDNAAVWIEGRGAPLVVAPAPYTEPGPGQIVVRTRAVAVNPVDRYTQKLGTLLYRWKSYPFVPGFDLAGEVAVLGPGVSRFRVGDRVAALAIGMEKSRNSSAEAAFQHYSVAMAQLTAPIPDEMSFAEAAVLPLGLSTAAVGLFEPTQLGLDRPFPSPSPKGRTVLVWSGSSSVGSNAIQLAVLAGYRVVTTASPRNADHVRRLGASDVFDHHAVDVTDRIVRSLTGHEVAGALAIGPGSAAACIEVMGACRGNRKVAIATFPLDIESLPDRSGRAATMLRMLPRMIRAGGALWIAAKRQRVRTSTIWGTALSETDLGTAIFEGFLPEALRSGRFVPSPAPLVVGQGLDAIQAAFDRQKAGVSAAKVVVEL